MGIYSVDHRNTQQHAGQDENDERQLRAVEECLERNSQRLAFNRRHIARIQLLAHANEMRVQAVRLLITANELRSEALHCQREADSFSDTEAFKHEIATLRGQAEHYQQNAAATYEKAVVLFQTATLLRHSAVMPTTKTSID